MSTITLPLPPVSPADPAWTPSPESLYRMTLEQYEAIVTAGVFTKRDRVQLVRGLLVVKMTQHTPHSTADELCGNALDQVIPAGWHVRSAKPIRIPGQTSKPEPDRSVVRGGIRDYSRRDPDPPDVGLVVEVADSRLREARDLIGVYAGGGIPVYWIVNLVDRQVEVYSGGCLPPRQDPPQPGGYQSRVDFKSGQAVPVVIDGQQLGQIAVDDVLP